MNISFRQLRLWLALAETGSVGAAAAMNHVTQPTASMQLKQLTRAVGMPLYEVISRKVYLTQAGEELTRTARAITAEWEAMAQKLKAAGIRFVIEPYVRFKGEVGEQATMFFLDPSGNAIEFKAMANPDYLFAK